MLAESRKIFTTNKFGEFTIRNKQVGEREKEREKERERERERERKEEEGGGIEIEREIMEDKKR